MRKLRGWWWPALIVAMGATVALLPLPWLVVLEGHQLRYAFPGPAGTTFVLRWMHSVEKEDWEERFQIQPDGGLILRSVFSSGKSDRIWVGGGVRGWSSTQHAL